VDLNERYWDMRYFNLQLLMLCLLGFGLIIIYLIQYLTSNDYMVDGMAYVKIMSQMF